MDAPDALALARHALWLVLVLSAPAVIVASVVGLLIAILQAATQIQEQTVQFAAKLLTMALTLFLTGALLGGSLIQFGDRVFSEFPAMVRR